jgi:aspartokinase/homoserine dehydrogenase 1
MASDLVNTGDKVHEVYGCLSGTMAYILDTFDKDLSFTDAAKQAVKMGYAHHNVAHDLDGTNAARKLVIIARELGMDLNLEDVKRESLLPAGKTPMIVDLIWLYIGSLLTLFALLRLRRAERAH